MTEPNGAYSTVIAHEYGHFIVNELGIAQGSFGEGFAGTGALLIYDDKIEGRDYFGPGQHVRDYSVGTHPYPCPSACNGEVHCCGRTLADLWVDIRDQLGLTLAQDLFRDWAMITLGGAGSEAAHPLTLIEILTVDDSPLYSGDTNLANGTPHCAAICTASTAHGLPCNSQGCTAGPPPAPPGTHAIVSFKPVVEVKTTQSGVNGVDPFGIAVGDLNNDGKPDVVLACETSDNVLVYLRHPTAPLSPPVFVAPSIYSVGSGRRPAKVALTHMSLTSSAPDSYLDIVVSLQGSPGVAGGVQILINNGDGTFPTSSQYQRVTDSLANDVLQPIGLLADDWNNDGRGDVAIAGYKLDGSNTRAVLGMLWARSDGTFRQARTEITNVGGRGWGLAYFINEPQTEGPSTGLQYQRIAMTDGTNSNNFYVFKYVGGTNPTYSQVTHSPFTGLAAQGVVAAKQNADYPIDLAVTAGDVWWYKQSPTDTFTFRGESYNTGSQGLAAGLISKKDTLPPALDNLVDLVAIPQYTYDPDYPSDTDFRIYVLVNTGVEIALFHEFRFAVTADPNAAPSSRDVTIADIDLDGFPDVLVANMGIAGSSDSWEGFSILQNDH